MSKILVVFGATGQQGGSVANYVLDDPQLSKEFKVRAVTRDPSQPAAQALKNKGAEIAKCDVNDPESIKQVVQGAHTVFGVTVTVYDDKLKPRELAQGKAMADAAVAAGAQYFIFSTLPYAGKITGGKHKISGGRYNTDHFDVKAEIEEYMRTLPIKSAFFSPGAFMQNYTDILAPHPMGDGTYAISCVVSPESELPLIDAMDSGKYVGAILADPDKYEGKIFSAATELKSYEEVAQAVSVASGKTVKYNQVSEDVFRRLLPAAAADHIVDMLLVFDEFGYFGPQTEEFVASAVKNARGKLTTFEEYLTNNPIKLQ